jgi:tetratricopeptide (TPR) repeat protein
MNTELFEQQSQRVLQEFHAGNLDSAAALLDPLLAHSGNRPDLLQVGAVIALRSQRFKAAEDLARRAVGARTESTDFRFTLAQVLSATQRYEEALAELRQILRIDPAFHKAHTEIWDIMDASGRAQEALSVARQRLAVLDSQCRIEPRKLRVPIPDTTLCCIDCKSHALAIRALRISMAGCEFPRAVFFTDRDFDIEAVDTVVIDPIRSLQDYSRFVVKQLLHHVNTEYVLIIQWDGYIVNPEMWSEQFLLFDYIGARWPGQIGAHSRHGAHNIRIPAAHAVGNGGFSLRSRTLLEALQDPRITLGAYPEDMAICLTYHEYLERQYGIAFAPAEVADQFSFERVGPSGPTFGFHGHININRFVDDPVLRMLEVA